MDDFPGWERFEFSSDELLATISSEYGRMLMASNKGDKATISKAAAAIAFLAAKMDEYFGVKDSLEIPAEPTKLFTRVEDKDL